MKETQLKNIGFEIDDKYYEFGFGIKEVRALSQHSAARKGEISDLDFIKFALQQNSKAGYISEKRVKDIRQALYLNGVETEEGEMEYEELIAYLIGLFAQAIDEEAQTLEPAIVNVKKNNTVIVTVDGQEYKLMFTREIAEQALETNQFDFNNILELYTFGSRLIRTSMEHYGTRFSVGKHEKIFLSIWATKFNEETEDDLLEVINALSYHMGEVIDSGVKTRSSYQSGDEVETKQQELSDVELKIAAQYPEIEEYDKNDVGAYLRWQYGIYSSFGMSYEEFWQKDYRLIDSYIKKQEMDIERETANNWELINLIREALLEIASQIYADPKKKSQTYKFPEKPQSRTHIGQLKDNRNKIINKEINEHFNRRLRERNIKK